MTFSSPNKAETAALGVAAGALVVALFGAAKVVIVAVAAAALSYALRTFVFPPAAPKQP